MAAKPLILFSYSQPYGVLKSAECRGTYIYVAAHSVEDARRVCVEAGLMEPSRSNIQSLWSKGGWGTPMNGITPERGIWVQRRGEQPVRVMPVVRQSASPKI